MKKKPVRNKQTRKRKKSLIKNAPLGILDIDTIYKVINEVQLDRVKATFSVVHNDAAVVENIIKDLALIYNKKVKVKSVEFSIQPAPQPIKGKGAENIEELSDEILEEGQIYF